MGDLARQVCPKLEKEKLSGAGVAARRNLQGATDERSGKSLQRILRKADHLSEACEIRESGANQISNTSVTRFQNYMRHEF